MPRLRKIFRFACRGIFLFVLLSAATLFCFRLESTIRESEDPKLLAPMGGKFIDTEGGRIFAQERGRADAPVVVLLHGTGAWSEAWKPTLEYLAARGYRAVALDVPPFGISSPPVSGKFDRKTLAALLAATLEEMEIREFHLLGHSFGAQTTVTLAEKMGARVRKLILVNAALGWTKEAPAAAPGFVRALLDTGWARNTLASVFTSPLLSRRLLRLFVLDPAHASPEWVERFAPPLKAPGKTAAIGEWLRELALSEDRELADENYFRRFAVPALVIWGARDPITPPWQGEKLAATLPSARLDMIPEIAHMPHVEAPEHFQKSVADFLDEK